MDYQPDTLSGRRLQAVDNAIRYRERQVRMLDAVAPASTSERLLGSELTRRNANGLLWDVVYLVARGEFSGEELGVTDLYLSLGVSKGTALRALDRLLDLECVEKRRNHRDSRRTDLRLTRTFRETFEDLLDAMIEDALQLPRAADD